MEGLTGKQVLIVDDSQANLDLLAGALKSADIRVVDLKNGIEIIGTLERSVIAGNPFHCCIINIHMPGMDGFEIAEKIRSSNTPIVAKLPLIAASDVPDQSLDSLITAGFNQAVIQPVQRETLFQVFEEVLEGNKQSNSKQMPSNAPEITNSDEVSFKQTHILVAEDNYINQELIKIMLENLGCKITIVSNGQEAVDSFLGSPHNFDLILMDLRMPELDGFGALKVIRAKGFNVPVIALTGHSVEGHRNKCLEAGMDDFLAKPIRKNILAETLLKFIKPGI